MSDHVKVVSSVFVKDIGYWLSESLRRPVLITHHGRVRLILDRPTSAQLQKFDAPVVDESRIGTAGHEK